MTTKCNYLKSGHENALPEDKAQELTLEEIKALKSGDHVYIRGVCGHLLPVKVNGKPQTWKRSPSKVKVPYKYGLYEYGYLTEADKVYKPKSK